MRDDSIDGIYDTLKQCALISKSAGGIGLAVSCIRATGSYIAGVSETQGSRSSQNRGAVMNLLCVNYTYSASFLSDKRHFQRPGSHAPSLQQHSALC